MKKRSLYSFQTIRVYKKINSRSLLSHQLDVMGDFICTFYSKTYCNVEKYNGIEVLKICLQIGKGAITREWYHT